MCFLEHIYYNHSNFSPSCTPLWRLPMSDILKTLLNRRILLICLFVLTSGISAGLFLSGLMPTAEKLHLASLIQACSAHYLYALISNIIYISLIAVAGITLYGFPLALLLLFARAFAAGFTGLFLIHTNNITMLLSQIMLCLIFTLITTASVTYALQHLKQPQ